MYSCVDGFPHRLLETLFLSRCHTATALSVSLRSPRSPCVEGFCAGDSVYVPSFLWKEVPRRGGGWLPQRDEKKREESALSYRHPEWSRGIFFVCRFLFPT